ncbi:MAG: helix-turn-helix domain-containing protein [Christensenellales bacterium]
MDEHMIIDRIRTLCADRDWSIYRLAKESGIAYSTLNTMLIKTNVPSINTLLRICKGFGITISQFFCVEESSDLSELQQQCLDLFTCLDDYEQQLALVYLAGLAKRKPVTN